MLRILGAKLHDCISRILFLFGPSFFVLLPALAFANPVSVAPPVQHDPELRRVLAELLIENPKWHRLAVQREFSVAVVDHTNLYNPRFAGINSETMMYGASIPKILILWALAKKLETGEIKPTLPLFTLASRMIRFSSNRAATAILHLVGGHFIRELVLAPQYQFYSLERGGGLWIGKEYGPSEAWEREPLYGFSHAASAWQVARFYLLLESGGLVGSGWGAVMKSMLSHPGIPHKFMKALNGKIDPRQVWRKSGGWGDMHADSVRVKINNCRYILVGFMNNSEGDAQLTILAERVHRYFTQRCAAPSSASTPPY